MAGLTEQERLFKHWLTQGYNYRKRRNIEMQRDPRKYKERLQHEYKIICDMNFVDYFMIVSDIVRWSKDRGIVVGPGRGSSVGSLISYLLRITEVDPLQYPVLFERFISPDRVGLPDIDLDFEEERRDEAIAYAQDKYGNDCVANILNFVRYKGRNSLDDIARVYRIPEWKITTIKDRLIERPEGHPRYSDTLQDTYDSYPDIAAMVKETPELALATKLEGNYRNTSFHAAGVAIGPLQEICATYLKKSGVEHGHGIAYDKKDAEYLGLLKIDFLSLLTLSSTAATLNAINSTINDLYQVPLDDPKVYKAFCAGDVLGIFQFEGPTTRRILKQVQPTKFMDLSNINALARPGANDKQYIINKRSDTKITFVHPVMKTHLEWTHGVIVYEEQILMILRDLGNFPPEATNRIRKVIHDKLGSTSFNEYQERFIEGAETHGLTYDKSLAIWQSMISASGYAFIIAHSVSYSMIAYWQMWLKVNYPAEFYYGQLLKCPSGKDDVDRRRKLIVEAERHGIKVSAPSLLYSQENWTLNNKTLYAGFNSIKGIGSAMSKAIVEWRQSRITTSLYDKEQFWIANELVWDDLKEVSGIGPGRIQIIKGFCESDDPFDALKVKRIMDSLRKEFENGEFPGIPQPTHNSVDVSSAEENSEVVYMGILRTKTYKDAVEQRLKYGPDGLTREGILERLDNSHLLKYAVLDVEDEYDEPIKIRISRKKFPEYRWVINKAKIDKHVILVKGYISNFGGLAIQAKELIVIDLEE